jgi:hypothetical protein
MHADTCLHAQCCQRGRATTSSSSRPCDLKPCNGARKHRSKTQTRSHLTQMQLQVRLRGRQTRPRPVTTRNLIKTDSRRQRRTKARVRWRRRRREQEKKRPRGRTRIRPSRPRIRTCSSRGSDILTTHTAAAILTALMQHRRQCKPARPTTQLAPATCLPHTRKNGETYRTGRARMRHPGSRMRHPGEQMRWSRPTGERRCLDPHVAAPQSGKAGHSEQSMLTRVLCVAAPAPRCHRRRRESRKRRNGPR